jgi:hypothetical protein
MNLEKIKEKPLFQITAGEFIFLQRGGKTEGDEEGNSITKIDKKYVYGIRGIAGLLDCSQSSANRLKKSGVIDDAITQNGRKIIVDAELALKLIKESH